jgi:hypothetical protein
MALASGLFDARPQVGSLARLVRRPCGQVPPDLDAIVDRL